MASDPQHPGISDDITDEMALAIMESDLDDNDDFVDAILEEIS